MATTTPNFGWPVPTSTDLVKDGATAMEALGDAIDTSMVDLKGGTTGQVLSKNSNTDMDFVWVTDAGGDITGVTAGTGISGGGTSGTVTVTNSMATAIDAKGDLIAGTGADAFSRLAVGTDGQVLTAASGQSTGLQWTTISTSSTFVGCRVTNSVAQSISNTTRTALSFDTESFDTSGFHSTTVSPQIMTVPSGKAGKYLITGGVTFATNSSGNRELYIFLNGGIYSSVFQPGTSVGSTGMVISDIIDMAVGDYVTLRVEQDSGSTIDVRGNNWGIGATYFGITYLGA